MNTNTIAAIATALSPAGISIVRISGAEAFSVIDRIYRSPKGTKKLSAAPSHTVHYGYIYDGEQMIDEVMVVLMRGPKSYTAEDTVEINCHGGVYVTKRILETVLKYGAVPAEPGEFTKRAFLNGRVDLARAEAVMDLIQAQNQFAMESSLSQMRGSLSAAVRQYRDQILDSIAFIEAALDDPEHISMEHYGDTLKGQMESIIAKLDRLIEQSDSGRVLAEGIRTVILGKPNAGKSSVLNLLMGEERAIVTDVAGTTRDTLQEQVRIGDVTFQIVDTAGIRRAEDKVEQIGVEKAKEAAGKADLILYVIDSSKPLDENDREVMELIGSRKAVILMNKTDLNTAVLEQELKDTLPDTRVCCLSAKTGEGLLALQRTLKEMFYTGEINFNDQVIVTNIRHKQALCDARESLLLVCQSIADGMPEDFFSIDLMSAYASLGSIIGEEAEDDLVNRIFAKFCMGK